MRIFWNVQKIAPQTVYTIVYTTICAIFLAVFFAAGFFVVSAQETQDSAASPVVEVANVEAGAGSVTADVRVSLPESATTPLQSVLLSWRLVEPAYVAPDGAVSPEVLYAAGKLTDKNGKALFSILPGETLERKITAEFSEETRSVDHVLAVSLFAPFAGRMVASVATDVRLSGGGNLFSLDPYLCTLRIGPAPIFSTPIFKAGEQPRLVCQIGNPFAKARTAVPTFLIAERSLYQKDTEIIERRGNAISLTPFETKIADIEIPFAPEKPQLYEAVFFLQDAEGKQASPKRLFRWVVQGASAAIERASFDKDGYAKGETATLALEFSQSADVLVARATNEALRESAPERWRGTPLQNPRVVVEVRSGRRMCGSAEEQLPPLASSQFSGKLEIPITRNCVNPVAEIRIYEGDQELTAATYRTRSLSTTAERLSSRLWWYVLGAVLLLAVAGGGVFLKKKQEHPENGGDDIGDTQSDDDGSLPRVPSPQDVSAQKNSPGEEDLRFIYPAKDEQQHTHDIHAQEKNNDGTAQK